LTSTPNQSSPYQSQFYSDPIYPSFAKRILNWFDTGGRHDLPWQQNPTPYRIWISEIMLQQTQVATVIPYYHRFMNRFASVQSLATADIDQVLHLWTGLGYYARARNLHQTAILIVENYQGVFPTTVEELKSLPGIGKSTAGAIVALAMNISAPILDGNVKRVLSRVFTIDGWPEQVNTKNQLWEIAERLTPSERVAEYTQAMMDLGATVCTRANPACDRCPFNSHCKAYQQECIANYPGKKPRKALPVKSVTMFILQNEAGEVLLEKRPAQGIWGSLYSLPEGQSETMLPQLNHIQVSIENVSKLDPLRHSFSHYHLDISPVRFSARRIRDAVAEKDRWLWYPLDHSIEVGLAAPIKKLLSQLSHNQ